VKKNERLAGTNLTGLVYAYSIAGRRRPRLFAAACCRRLWHVLDDEACRRAVEVAERFADERAPDKERARAFRAACRPRGRHPPPVLGQADGKSAAYHAAAFAAAGQASRACTDCSAYALHHFAWNEPGRVAEERAAQVLLLHDIFGGHSRHPPAVDPAWLDWNAGTVRRLAEAAYEDRLLPGGTLDNARLAVLADALEEAGCGDAQILDHLRGPGPHVRGCHLVDLLTGRT
jgi:hypothetical protein